MISAQYKDARTTPAVHQEIAANNGAASVQAAL